MSVQSQILLIMTLYTILHIKSPQLNLSSYERKQTLLMYIFKLVNDFTELTVSIYGDNLRKILEDKELSVSPGRKNATEISLFTSLVEGEALQGSGYYCSKCQDNGCATDN